MYVNVCMHMQESPGLPPGTFLNLDEFAAFLGRDAGVARQLAPIAMLAGSISAGGGSCQLTIRGKSQFGLQLYTLCLGLLILYGIPHFSQGPGLVLGGLPRLVTGSRT